MHIAVLGAGNVGGTLGKRWAGAGNQVTFGVRDPDDAKIQTLVRDSGANAAAASIADAARNAEIVVLAVPWDGVREVLHNAGNLAGKIVVDATNPLVMTPEGLKQGLVVGHTTSGAEQAAQWAPEARVVKAFNTTGWQNMANPSYGSNRLTMCLCGDHAEAKAAVADLAGQLDFEPVDVGPLRSARYLEAMAMLWIDMALFRDFGTDFGFRMETR